MGSLELIEGGLAGKLETRPSLELHLCLFPKHPSLGTCWSDCCLIQGGFYVLMCPVLRNLAYIYFIFLLVLFNYVETFCMVLFPPSQSSQTNLGDSPCTNGLEYKNKPWERPQESGAMTALAHTSTETSEEQLYLSVVNS